MQELTDIRKQLDALDAEILRALINRQELVTQVITYKNENNLPIRDKKREKELIAAKLALAGDRLSADFVKKIFKIIIGESRRLQKKLRK